MAIASHQPLRVAGSGKISVGNYDFIAVAHFHQNFQKFGRQNI
jgi:hypothetical protein